MKAIQNEKVINKDFWIREIDLTELSQMETSRLMLHRIFLLSEAKSQVLIDDQHLTLGAARVLLVAKGQVLSFAEPKQIKGYEIAFSDAFWEKAPQSASNCKSVLFDQQATNQLLPLTQKDLEELTTIMAILLKDFCAIAYTNQSDTLAAYLKIIMIKLANINYASQNRYDSYDKKTFATFLHLVDSNYNKTREVAYYADSLHLSARQLSNVCHKLSGESPKRIIAHKVLSEAKRMLQFTATPIKEITDQLNFASIYQFSHFFKKETQLSPQNYRNTYVNNDKRKA